MGQTFANALNQLTASEISAFMAVIGSPISVKTYGAVGNGENDDTTAIQNAINACSTAGVPCYIPAGTYLVSDTLLIRPNVHFYGDGVKSKLFLKASTSKNVIGCSLTDELDNFSLVNFSIHGNNTNQVDAGSSVLQNGICLYQNNSDNLKNFRITGVEITQCKKAGIYLGRMSYSSYSKVVAHNKIYSNYANGIFIDDLCEYIALNANIIDFNAGAGLRIVGSNINVSGGTIKGNANGYAVHATIGNNTCKLLLTGVTMNHSKGLLFDGVTMCNITGCQILASELDGIKLNASSFINITSNVIGGSSQDATNTYSEIKLVGSDNNIISNNIINPYSAIKAKYAVDCDADSESNLFTYNKWVAGATDIHNINAGENTII